MTSPLRQVLKVTISNPTLQFHSRRGRLPSLSPPKLLPPDLRNLHESRIPHKYDHFHEKTYEVDFVPKFYMKRFERKSGIGGMRGLELVHAFKAITRRKTARTCRTRSFTSRQTPVKSPIPSHQPRQEASISPTPLRCSHRSVLCVQDGSTLDSPALHTLTVDLGEITERYIGTRSRNNPHSSLSVHALEELMERGNRCFRPKNAFTAVYLVSGESVSDAGGIPADCKVLVLGWTEGFLGLR